MSLFTLTLPLTPAGPEAEYAHAFSPDGLNLQTQGCTRLDLLPRPASPACEIVAVVPVLALSWHRVTLPPGTLGARGAARIPLILQGLLEDQLLEDSTLLHWALPPGAREGQPLWIAACARAWLHGHMAALEGTGRAVARVVPECSPGPRQEDLQALAGPYGPLLLHSGEAAPQCLPLGPASLCWLLAQAGSSAESPDVPDAAGTPTASGTATRSAMPPAVLHAEPALIEALQQLSPEAQVLPRSAAERSLLAAQGAWDLAQFELAGAGKRRLRRQLGKAWQAFWNAPRWRLVRSGLASLVLIQLLGLNAWAWHEKTQLAQDRRALNEILTSTFPQVSLVIDAPLQMRRELALLQQAAGVRAPHDLENVLQILGETLPAQASVQTLDHGPGETRLRSAELNRLSERELSPWQNAWRARGFRLRRDGDSWLVQADAEAAVAVPGGHP